LVEFHPVGNWNSAQRARRAGNKP